MVEITQVVVLKDKLGWSVRVSLKQGAWQRYRYGSEAQARYFAAVFALGPRVLPPPTERGFPLPMRARFGEAAAVSRR